MDILEAIDARHSVRRYDGIPISDADAEALLCEIAECNRESGLNIQLVRGEEKAFGGRMAHYGEFSGVRDYIVLIGRRGADLGEKCGYYGERLVLLAQTLGLNTCWVGLTYSKVRSSYTVRKGEKLLLVIAVGHGETAGRARKSKTREQVSRAEGAPPDWFTRGVDAALKAPTALNQQKFMFTLRGNMVTATTSPGFFVKTDLGIAKLHFELGAGKENFTWAE